MKIRLEKTFRSYELYNVIEFNPEEYPEFEGKSEEEIVEYLQENVYDFMLKDQDEPLYDQFVYYGHVEKEKIMDEEVEVVKVGT